MRKPPVGRNAINPVYVAWSAGGKRTSAIMAGGSQPANRDPTNNWHYRRVTGAHGIYHQP